MVNIVNKEQREAPIVNQLSNAFESQLFLNFTILHEALRDPLKKLNKHVPKDS